MVFGSGFSSDSLIYFGGIQARSVTFINASAWFEVHCHGVAGGDKTARRQLRFGLFIPTQPRNPFRSP